LQNEELRKGTIERVPEKSDASSIMLAMRGISLIGCQFTASELWHGGLVSSPPLRRAGGRARPVPVVVSPS
jgi:hypothetical protein